MELLIVAAGVVVGAGWLPVVVFFWNAWRRRKNPISLAIAGVAAFCTYFNWSIYLFLQNEPAWTASTVLIVNVIVLLNFYISFRWAKKSFKGQRKEQKNGQRGHSYPSTKM